MVEAVYLICEAIESNAPLEDATVYFAFAGLIAFVSRSPPTHCTPRLTNGC